MRLSAIAAVGAVLIAAVVLVNVPATVLAAPALQLPWPTGEQHRIWGGYTYGCGTHGGPGYETNYYAIDFVFSIGQNVSGTAGGTVIIAAIGYNGGAGNYLAVDHGGGFVPGISTYAPPRHLRRVWEWVRLLAKANSSDIPATREASPRTCIST